MYTSMQDEFQIIILINSELMYKLTLIIEVDYDCFNLFRRFGTAGVQQAKQGAHQGGLFAGKCGTAFLHRFGVDFRRSRQLLQKQF